MKNNLTILLTLLVLLVSFFSSTTYTGEITRDLRSGAVSEGGVAEANYYFRGDLPFVPPLYGQKRIYDYYEQYKETLFADGVGDINEDGEITKEDCWLLQQRWAQVARYSSPRIPAETRFANPQVAFDPKYDINRDGSLTSSGDVDPFCSYAQGLGAGSPFRERQIQRYDCAKEGRTFCRNGLVVRCSKDDYGTLMLVEEQKPSPHARCIIRSEERGTAHYAIIKPTLTLYDDS